MTQERFVQVTEGLVGERADAGIAKLLGMSRAKVSEMIEAGLVTQNEKVISKSDPLLADAWLKVLVPKPKPALALVPELIPDLKVIYQDADIVVVRSEEHTSELQSH